MAPTLTLPASNAKTASPRFKPLAPSSAVQTSLGEIQDEVAVSQCLLFKASTSTPQVQRFNFNPLTAQDLSRWRCEIHNKPSSIKFKTPQASMQYKTSVGDCSRRLDDSSFKFNASRNQDASRLKTSTNFKIQDAQVFKIQDSILPSPCAVIVAGRVSGADLRIASSTQAFDFNPSSLQAASLQASRHPQVSDPQVTQGLQASSAKTAIQDFAGRDSRRGCDLDASSSRLQLQAFDSSKLVSLSLQDSQQAITYQVQDAASLDAIQDLSGRLLKAPLRLKLQVQRQYSRRIKIQDARLKSSSFKILQDLGGKLLKMPQAFKLQAQGLSGTLLKIHQDSRRLKTRDLKTQDLKTPQDRKSCSRFSKLNSNCSDSAIENGKRRVKSTA
ncbi:hypothetical protein K438DRAFT_2108277 [Mycena galopus ATCC 62051]|nr:hypothetical protein K438DRAFT_2108277 [Mycena galopus ATCC 62051]